MRQPRIKIINHRAGDVGEGSSELLMSWERKQVINDALSHIQRTAKNLPDSISTTNQVSAAKWALGSLRQEVDAAMKLLLEK